MIHSRDTFSALVFIALVAGGMLMTSVSHAQQISGQQISVSYQQLAAAFAIEGAGRPEAALHAAQSLIDGQALTPVEQASALDLEGICYEDLDRPAAAVHALEEAEHLLGPQDGKEMRAVLNNMGRAYGEQGQVAPAEHLYTRAYRLAEAAGDHADMARIASNQAGLMLGARRDKPAREYLERADREAKLAMDLDRDGLDRDDLASMVSMQGWLALDKGDARAALELYQHALELWREKHGVQHPLTAWGMLLVGKAEAAVGDSTAAVREMREGLRLTAATLGETSRNYAVGEMAYAHLLEKNGSADQAAALLADARTKAASFTSQRCRDCTVSVEALR